MTIIMMMMRMKQYNPVSVMYNKSLPTNTKSIAAYFTRDYNMINPGHKHVGVQGGFLIVKPNVNAVNEYIAIVLKGKFANGAGWYDHKGGETYGGYFGAQQIQGIVSFYYDYYHTNTGIELNRCYINAMAVADAPRNHKGLATRKVTLATKSLLLEYLVPERVEWS